MDFSNLDYSNLLKNIDPSMFSNLGSDLFSNLDPSLYSNMSSDLFSKLGDLDLNNNFNQDYFSNTASQIEQAKKIEKEIRETPPYLPEKKNRKLILKEFNKSNFPTNDSQKDMFSLRQTFVTSNKHSSKVLDPSSLKQIYISEMYVNKINYGRYLICRTIAHPSKLVGIITVVEDERGDIENFSIYNYRNDENSEIYFPIGTVLFIKEPFLKLGSAGGRFIRIDSPTDIFVDDYNFSGNFQKKLNQLDKSQNWEDLKKIGNELYTKKNYEFALRYYKVAYQLNNNAILHLNCSAAYIGLKLYYQAYKEAEEAYNLLEKNEKNKKELEKATFRMATAFYNMKQYENAKKIYEECLTYNQNNNEAKNELKKSELRILEQKNGDYNFLQIYKDNKEKKILEFDIADYISPLIELKESKEKGKYLISKGEIKKGTILIVSKACAFGNYASKNLIISHNFITNLVDTPANVNLLKNLIFNSYGNPYLAQQVYALFCNNQYNRNENLNNIIDISRLETIASLNWFDGRELSNLTEIKKNDIDGITGLWIYPSYINHACISNTFRENIGDIMIVAATRNIKVNEEITTNYISSDSSFQERQTNLKSKWNFICCCDYCEFEKNDPKLKIRNKIIENDIPNLKKMFATSSCNKKNITNIYKKLKETYIGVPNHFKRDICLLKFMLSVYYSSKGNFDKAKKILIETYEIYKDNDNFLSIQTALQIASKCEDFIERNFWLETAINNSIYKNREIFNLKYELTLKQFKLSI